MTSPWLSFALLGFLFGPVGAQLGVDQCACFPSTYTFVLDLAQTCAETSLPNSGIDDTTCSVLPADPNTDSGNMIPTRVSALTIRELGQNLGTILTTEIDIDTSFISGKTLTYTSFVGTQEGLNTNVQFNTFPRGLELEISGLNLFGQTIVNRFTIDFSNACGIFPVVEEGDQIGWVNFGSLSDPLDAVCPEDTDSPTMVPTTAPVVAATSAPSRSPTSAPTNAPGPTTTIEPTRAPTSGGPASNGQWRLITLFVGASVAMALL